MFAHENGLMQGTGNKKFSPNLDTTRGMIVTILHRLEGNPSVAGENPFNALANGAYYSDLVLWSAD